jgi:hypothetical protein
MTRLKSSTQIQQQKENKGDLLESSLITLLNLAQEIGSSNNIRFRQAADKLKDQFARSFALRYDLDNSQFLSSALSSLDGESQLTGEQIAMRDTVLAQMKGIEGKASTIIFFNEPLTNLEEYTHPFTFSHNALQPVIYIPPPDENTDDLEEANEVSRIEQQRRNTQYVQSLLDRVKGISTGIFQYISHFFYTTFYPPPPTYSLAFVI